MQYATIYVSEEGYEIQGTTNSGRQVSITGDKKLTGPVEKIGQAVDAKEDELIKAAQVKAQEAETAAKKAETQMKALTAYISRWEVGAQLATSRLTWYGDKLYTILESHVATEDATPDKSPQFYKEVSKPAEGAGGVL